MNQPTFLHQNRPIVTALLFSRDETGLLTEISEERAAGADAFGLMLDRLPAELRTREKMSLFFRAMGDCPIYVTCYKCGDVIDETDEERASLLLSALACGATMADIRGDFFDPRDGEITFDETAVRKQTALIGQIHAMGKEALMSSHLRFGGAFRYLPPAQILKIAKAHRDRGADIVKIVSNADTEEELMSNFRILFLLREEISVPGLFLTNGKYALRHRLACGLIDEPMLFSKSRRFGSDYGAMQPTDRLKKLVEIGYHLCE